MPSDATTKHCVNFVREEVLFIIPSESFMCLERRNSSKMYHMGEYQEASVCLQSCSDGWIVYNGERGRRYNEVPCDTILKAWVIPQNLKNQVLGLQRKKKEETVNG